MKADVDIIMSQDTSWIEKEADQPENTLLSPRLCAHLKVPLGTKWGTASRRNSAASQVALEPSVLSNRAAARTSVKDSAVISEGDDASFVLQVSRSANHRDRLMAPRPPNETESMM